MLQLKLLETLRQYIKDNNLLYGQLQTNIDRLRQYSNQNVRDYRIVFLDKVASMPRTYNAPECSEVAVIANSDFINHRENYKRSVWAPVQYNGHLQEIKFNHPAFYPLCYPLFHLLGESGWHVDLKSNGRKVTLLDYCKYILQVRDDISNRKKDSIAVKLEKDIVLCGNALTQQYICDLYIANENNNLEWLRLNQKTIKAEVYCELLEAVHNKQGQLAGKYIVLPGTHIGSPRWYYGQYQDGMARCRRFHRPDLFITFTCNPNWEEIRNEMKGFELHTNSRPDLIARVFQIKLDAMMDDITKKQLFGKVVGYMYAMEWQKRGLPHAHILIFLDADSRIRTPDEVDKVISAELPHPETHKNLRRIVIERMIHGPCGVMNRKCVCCYAKGICEKGFPKPLSSNTVMTQNAYPEYRRRSVAEGGHYFIHNKTDKLDNSWVVPYNPYLLEKYDAHINVEICSSIKAIKYLNKYVFKGSDKAQIAVTSSAEQHQHTSLVSSSSGGTEKAGGETPEILIDEIQQYMDCRYIGPCEAAHRIFSFPMHDAKPSIEGLSIHLPDHQSVVYEDGLEEVVVNEGKDNPPHSMLLAYFDAVHEARIPNAIKLYEDYKSAAELTYQQMPEHYTLGKSKGKYVWNPRKQSMGDYPMLGRMFKVTPKGGKYSELYQLRTLLTKRPGIGSFEELRTYNGKTYNTFLETAIAMNLLKEDAEWYRCIKEMCETITNIRYLREAFVMTIFHNAPINPRGLWDSFKEYLCDDYKFKRIKVSEGSLPPNAPCTQDDIDCALHDIEAILQEPIYKKTLDDYNFPHPDRSKEDLVSSQLYERQVVDGIDTNSEKLLYEQMRATMNAEQLIAIDSLIDALKGIKDKNKERCFFLDAPGGTGKTFVLNAFVHYCRSIKKKVIVTAYCGVAANLLIMGRTCHSQFKFPLNQDCTEGITGTLKATEQLGKDLYEADVVILDEGPMMHKKYWEQLHATCIDLYRRFNPQAKNYNAPFAGKLIIGSGDLRQCLPVLKHGDRTTIAQSVMNRSHLWPYFKQLHLTVNERVMRNAIGLSEELRERCITFSRQLLLLGDGKLPFYDEHKKTVDISKVLVPALHWKLH